MILKQRECSFGKQIHPNDFYVFDNVQLPELNNQKLDLYFKVAKATSGNKEQSTVYLMVSKGYDNFVSPKQILPLFMQQKNFSMGLLQALMLSNIILILKHSRPTLQMQKRN
jgi:hypothetical protein